MRSSSWIFGLGCRLHEEGILLRETASSAEARGGGPLVSASPWGPEGSGSPCSSSPTISTSVTSSSSCSWGISSSRQASSYCIRQSSMRFSYFVIDLSTVLREVCRVFNLCSISRLDGASVINSMALDTASNSLCSLVHRLWHFHREEDASVCFFLMCLWFSLRTWVTTSSNCSFQTVPGPRK